VTAIRNVIVPDIGDFKEIPVIEILVKRGDRVTRDTPPRCPARPATHDSIKTTCCEQCSLGSRSR
jgi:hypothetical protein